MRRYKKKDGTEVIDFTKKTKLENLNTFLIFLTFVFATILEIIKLWIRIYFL